MLDELLTFFEVSGIPRRFAPEENPKLGTDCHAANCLATHLAGSHKFRHFCSAKIFQNPHSRCHSPWFGQIPAGSLVSGNFLQTFSQVITYDQPGSSVIIDGHKNITSSVVDARVTTPSFAVTFVLPGSRLYCLEFITINTVRAPWQ